VGALRYSEALDFVWGVSGYSREARGRGMVQRFDLQRVRTLLRAVGSPELRVPVAHVAGTKGKGSTCAILASILRQSGHRVGLYTSPHLHTTRERIQVDGEAISRETFASVIEEVMLPARDIDGLTSFDVLTAAAFVAFARLGVECAVVEAGMGGRLDATSVVSPFVTLITSISLDHTAVLGETLEEIAEEKAGILKRGVPAISSPQCPEAASVLRRSAERVGCDLEFVGRSWRFATKDFSTQTQRFAVQGLRRERPIADGEYELPLLGAHQVENAVLALAAAERAPLPLTHDHLARGLLEVKWPGRFEVVRRRPYVVLDGAHNGASMAKLVDALHRHIHFDVLRLVFGVSQDKDVRAMLSHVKEERVRLYACQSVHERAAPAQWIVDLAAEMHLPCWRCGSVAEALWQAVSESAPDDCICVCGSLFVVALAREAIALRWGEVSIADGEVEVISLVDGRRFSVGGSG